MKIFIGLFVCFFVGFVFSKNLGVAPIDFEYESRLYNIYRNFHSSPLSSNEWNTVVSSRNVNTYTVQKKDNLWDISQVLFGDSNYWPKLWSVNPYIANPHRIDVGSQLSVIMGSESSAPQVVVSAQKIPVESSVSGDSGVLGSLAGDQKHTVGSLSENICSKDLLTVLSKKGSTRVYSDGFKCRVIQKKLKERKIEDLTQMNKLETPSIPSGLTPHLGRIPKSLPVIGFQMPQDIIMEGLGRPSPARLNVIERYLVEKSDVQIVGKIRDYSALPIRESEIILELDIPVSRGTRLTLIRPLQKIQRTSLSIKGPFGYEVAVAGVAEILSGVPNESGYFFARVKSLYDPLSKGFQVVEGTPAVFDLKGKLDWSRGSAQVVGVAGNQTAQSLTIHTFVYLNRGKSDDVNPGETLKIWSNPSFHKRVERRALGKVLVVHASDNFSTGFVTQLNNIAYVGDYLRPPVELTSFAVDMDVYEAPEDLEREDEDTFVEPEEEEDEEEDEIFESAKDVDLNDGEAAESDSKAQGVEVELDEEETFDDEEDTF